MGHGPNPLQPQQGQEAGSSPRVLASYFTAAQLVSNPLITSHN